MTKLVIMGRPGAGKGTQAKFLLSAYANQGMVHVGTGDILRQAADARTPAGLEYLANVNNGGFVRDETIVCIVDEKLATLDSYVLDGFPRNLTQAELWNANQADHILVLDIPRYVAVERMFPRMVCTPCGTTYGGVAEKVSGHCDACAAPLTRRTDDAPEIVQKKLDYFDEHTAAVISRYQTLLPGKLSVINGAETPERVYASIAGVLRKARIGA